MSFLWQINETLDGAVHARSVDYAEDQLDMRSEKVDGRSDKDWRRSCQRIRSRWIVVEERGRKLSGGTSCRKESQGEEVLWRKTREDLDDRNTELIGRINRNIELDDRVKEEDDAKNGVKPQAEEDRGNENLENKPSIRRKNPTTKLNPI